MRNQTSFSYNLFIHSFLPQYKTKFRNFKCVHCVDKFRPVTSRMSNIDVIFFFFCHSCQLSGYATYLCFIQKVSSYFISICFNTLCDCHSMWYSFGVTNILICQDNTYSKVYKNSEKRIFEIFVVVGLLIMYLNIYLAFQ